MLVLRQHSMRHFAVSHEFEGTTHLVLKPIVDGLLGRVIVERAIDAGYVAYGAYHGAYVVAHQHYGAAGVEIVEELIHLCLAAFVYVG